MAPASTLARTRFDLPPDLVRRFNELLDAQATATRTEMHELRMLVYDLDSKTMKREVDTLKFLFGIYWFSSIVGLWAFFFLLTR